MTYCQFSCNKRASACFVLVCYIEKSFHIAGKAEKKTERENKGTGNEISKNVGKILN